MKTKLLRSLILIAVLSIGTHASAHDFEVDGIYYNILSETDKTVEVTNKGDYYESYSSNSVVIPESVTYNGISYSVTSIGEAAFYDSTLLNYVTIPKTITNIGAGAFGGTIGLISIVVESDNPKYDSRDNCNAIIETATNALISGCKTTVIPNSVTSIGSFAFAKQYTLINITIPNSVTSIGYGAFNWCSRLTNITIPNSVTSIGERAFQLCTGLTSVTIPNSVTSIGEAAFNGCDGLTSVTIGNSVTIIGNGAFSDCCDLTNVTIPNSVISIGDVAFNGCNITNITIPNSVTHIGTNAFGYNNLTSIDVNSGNTVYDSRDNCNAIIETATNTLIQGCNTTVIPNSVTSIGSQAFDYCTGLTSVTIPVSVTSIGGNAFKNCTNLTKVEYNAENCANIPNYSPVFSGCKTLSSIIIGENVKTIPNCIFSQCTGLTNITIPNSVTRIGYQAFKGCTGLTSVTIPESVTSIEGYAFSDCTGLTKVEYNAENCANIPNYYPVFSDCEALSSIIIGENVKTIPNNIFSRCTSLTNITIPSSVTTIGDCAFKSCTGLTSVTIPESVTTIGGWAFETCTGLTSIVIPNSVTSIGTFAFRWCTGLMSITVGNSVRTIWQEAFSGCTGLTNVTSLNPTPPDCGLDVFKNVNTQNITLSVPSENISNYQSADTWKGFGSIVGLESETPVEYGFEAEDITTLHNRTIDLPVSLINAGDVSAFQFDIYLPEGISIAIDEDEEYEMTLNQDRATSSHSVSTLKQPNGAIRYACYSTKSSAFKGESGTTLFTIPLTIAENLEGEYKVIIKDIILSSSDAQGYNCQDVEINITVKPYDYGDSNGDGNINIVDVVNTMNVVLGKDSARFIEEAADINADGQINIVDVVGTMNLVLGYTRTATPTSILKQISKKSMTEESVYIEDFSICATESKIIDLNMTNNQTYSAIQFDIVMPEGLTIDYDENEEEYLFESTDRFTKSHSINSNQLSENTIRVGIYSTKSKDFTANEGALIRIPFTASEDMAAGEYKVEIKGIVLSTSDSQGVYLPDTQATLIVYPATMTDVEETLYDVDVEYYNLQGVKVANKNLNQGVYIKKVGNNVSKIIVK